MAPGHTPSPGNAFSSGEPPMRMPHLELIYRVVALMGPGPGPSSSYSIPNVHGTGVTRLVLPIAGGTVRGPRISGEIVQNSGADWAQRIGGVGSGSTKSPTKLNACYTLRTDDGHFILVSAAGTVAAGPPTASGADRRGNGNGEGRGSAAAAARSKAPVTITQDDAEYFTQITFEAAGGSPYDWMNSVVAVGVMTMFEGRPVIDCYRLTNFPERGTAHL